MQHDLPREAHWLATCRPERSYLTTDHLSGRRATALAASLHITYGYTQPLAKPTHVLKPQDAGCEPGSCSPDEVDGEGTRKVLGSSVVTSVSVIMDLGNGSQGFADATGRPVEKPASADHLASPPSLMSPDRYEFYTFNDEGDLVKRLMTMDEIQGLIAGESVEIGSDLPGIEPDEAGHGEEQRPGSFFYLPHPLERTPDWSPPGVDKVVKKVQDVLADVQNRITIEEGNHVPSWGINRPNVPNPLLHPTQNIPGSILHLLKDTPEKFSTFVPPVQSFSTPKPDSQSNVDYYHNNCPRNKTTYNHRNFSRNKVDHNNFPRIKNSYDQFPRNKNYICNCARNKAVHYKTNYT
ncbi:Hypothetical predicted protein [Cloeon dipterum]|uniref:Uncharacterized protein n=1 Tax=Cloeon dipterum TaxID=197152 RepID=A0A8S1C9C8_9INSE|nr:Hypothetical predicted protein [Cloeon dipterum]